MTTPAKPISPANGAPVAGAAAGGGRDFWQKPWAQRLVFLALLLLVTIPVYRPALNRYFAGDQIYYFLELNNETTFSAGLHFLDYNTTRTYMVGDQSLYRPLLFTLLALENTLFEHDYYSWNIVSLCIHLAVVYALYELLRCLQPGIFAAAFALVFSVLTADFELIVWNHMGGYLLGYGLLLVALLAARHLTAGDEPASNQWLVTYALTMLAAMLCYEMPVISAVLMVPYFGFYWWKRRPAGMKLIPTGAAVLAPLAVYGVLYIFHMQRAKRLFWVDPHSGGAATPLLLRVPQSLGFWAAKALNPWYAAFAIQPAQRFGWARDVNLDSVAGSMVAVALVVAGLVFCCRAGFTKRNLAANGPMAVLLVVILVAYSALNNLGRNYTLGVTYYLYFFSLISTVLVYTLVDFSRLVRGWKYGALALLALIGAVNTVKSYQTSAVVADKNVLMDQYFDFLDKFVQQHRNEPNFGYAVQIDNGAKDLNDPKNRQDLNDLIQQTDPLFGLAKGFPDEQTNPPKSYAEFARMEDSKYYFIFISNMIYPKYYDIRLYAAHNEKVAPPKYFGSWTPGLVLPPSAAAR